MVFDSKAEIDMDAGSITFNANVIWAATTNQSSIQFGEPDPAGYYDKVNPPPLMQGLTYSWAVINNYCGSPSMLSSSFSGLRSFTVLPAASCDAPVLVSPDAGGSITRPADVVLSWNAASGANSYAVFLMKVEEGGFLGEGSAIVPFWSANTTGTSVTVPANIAMNNNDYEWYVVALDNTGRGAKSEVRRFWHYHPGQTDLEISVWEDGPLGVTVVPEAIIFLETETGGSANIFPYTASEEGMFYYDLPPGNYRVRVMKEGFDTVVEPFIMPYAGATVQLSIQLERSGYSVSGIVRDNNSALLSGASILAVYSGTTYTASAVSQGNGSFLFYAGSVNGDWNITVSKAGYTTAFLTASVAPGDNEHIIAAPVVLTKLANTLNGAVTNSSSQGIAGAVVRAEENGNPSNFKTANTNSSGNYTMSLDDGDYIVTVSKPGFTAPAPVSVSLNNGETKARNFTMQEQACQISGVVTLSGAGMSGVLVRAVPTAGSPVETYTGTFGEYSLNTGTGDYTVTAFKEGYTSAPSSIPVSFTLGGEQSSDNDFVMTANPVPDNAAVYVYVSDIATSAPVQGAYISLLGMTTSFPGSGFTSAAGGVTITALREDIYSITISKTGYAAYNGLTPVLTNGNTVNVSAGLTPLVTTGTISGLISSGANPLAGAVVEVFEQTSPDTPVYTTVTADAGTYLAQLLPGNYTVKARKTGYSAVPAQVYIVLLASETKTADFTLTEASGGGITVTPPSGDIYNENIGGPYQFSAVYLDGMGNNVEAQFVWSLVPAEAGTITQSGVLTVTTDYIGEAAVRAAALGRTGSVTVPVYQRLNPSYGEVNVKDYAGFALQIPAGAADPANSLTKITMKKYAPSSSMAAAGSARVLGNCLLYTSPSPRDRTRSRMPSSA